MSNNANDLPPAYQYPLTLPVHGSVNNTAPKQEPQPKPAKAQPKAALPDELKVHSSSDRLPGPREEVRPDGTRVQHF